MKKQSRAKFWHNYKTTAFLTCLILLSAAFGYYAVKTLFFSSVEPASADLSSDLKPVENNRWETQRFIYHGIPARVVFELPPKTATSSESLNTAVWNEFDRIGKIFNPFKPDSEISHLNSMTGFDPIPISKDVYQVMRISKQIWKDTNGRFDPTVWQIKELWQHAEKIQKIPTEKQITDALQWTGFDNVILSDDGQPALRFKNHPVRFDFGGIVKGYAVDRVRKLLMDAGATDGLVQLGGEICTFGKNGKNPWRIGIQHPKQMDKIWGVISSENPVRVSTSGNYRQPILINGKSFYHIFSPDTGKPVSEKVLGVTTACLDAENANAALDAIATAITVMGTKKGMALAKKMNIDAVILYEKNDGSIGETITPGLSGYYQKTDQ